MNTLTKILVLIFSIGIFLFVSGNLIWTNQKLIMGRPEVKPAGVLITTDKTVYRQGEVIRVSIKNNLNESIFCHIGVEGIKHIERKTAEGNWEQLFVMCKYPHCIYKIAPPKEIIPGECRIFEWKPLIYIDGTSKTVQAGPGQYRLSFFYQDHMKTELRSVYSNVFMIEEP